MQEGRIIGTKRNRVDDHSLPPKQREGLPFEGKRKEALYHLEQKYLSGRVEREIAFSVRGRSLATKKKEREGVFGGGGVFVWGGCADRHTVKKKKKHSEKKQPRLPAEASRRDLREEGEKKGRIPS